MELTECDGLYCCFIPPFLAAASPDLPYPQPYLHIDAAASVPILLGHGSRTRGLVAGIATPGDGGVRGEGRHPNPSGDVGTWIGEGIPRRRRM